MKKIVVIVFFIVVICLIILPFTNLTTPDPIPLKVTAEDTQIPVDIGFYCGEGFVTGHCTHSYGEDESSAETVEVAPGSILTFSFEIKPKELQLIRRDSDGIEEDRRSYLEDEKREVTVPKKAGVYFYSFEGSWGEKDRRAEYQFSVKVK